MFFDYASYTSALVWMALFGTGQIRDAFRKMKEQRAAKNGENINHQYGDQLNILQRSYKEVPFWWYVTLFLCSFVVITLLAKGFFFIPIWTYFVWL
jgi:hypothetical protein